MPAEKYLIRKIVQARILRRYRGGLLKKMTLAESAFAQILNESSLDFIPQAGFLTASSFYITDFYIKSPYKLVIEIDGKTHKSKKSIVRDRKKIRYLRKSGFEVLRFRDEEVLGQTSKVRRQIQRCLSRLRRRSQGHVREGIPTT